MLTHKITSCYFRSKAKRQFRDTMPKPCSEMSRVIQYKYIYIKVYLRFGIDFPWQYTIFNWTVWMVSDDVYRKVSLFSNIHHKVNSCQFEHSRKYVDVLIDSMPNCLFIFFVESKSGWRLRKKINTQFEESRDIPVSTFRLLCHLLLIAISLWIFADQR